MIELLVGFAAGFALTAVAGLLVFVLGVGWACGRHAGRILGARLYGPHLTEHIHQPGYIRVRKGEEVVSEGADRAREPVMRGRVRR